MSDFDRSLNIVFMNLDKFVGVDVPMFINRKSRGLGQIMQREIKIGLDSGPIPINRTGNLRKRTHFSLNKSRGDADLVIYNDAKYAGWLEFGWERPKGKLHGPYPFMTPVVKRVLEEELRKWTM